MEYQDIDWESEALYWKGKYIRELARQALIEQHDPQSHQDWAHPESSLFAKGFSEDDLNAMCETLATNADKERCREYNMREAEYYNKRAELDAQHQSLENFTLGDK